MGLAARDENEVACGHEPARDALADDRDRAAETALRRATREEGGSCARRTARGQAYSRNPADIGIGAHLPSPNAASDSKGGGRSSATHPQLDPPERSGPGHLRP